MFQLVKVDTYSIFTIKSTMFRITKTFLVTLKHLKVILNFIGLHCVRGSINQFNLLKKIMYTTHKYSFIF